MNGTTSQIINGILVVTTKTETSTKTIRYIDGTRGLILDVLEEFKDRSIFTKYKTNGLQPKTIEITTKNKVTLYQGDGKTPISIKEINEDSSIKTTSFRLDGKTIEKIKSESPQGISQTIYYHTNGQTQLKSVEVDADGMTKTIFYDPSGQLVQSIQEDMADGSVLKTFFRPDMSVEKTWESHIKGLLKNQIRETLFDKTGKKKISTKDFSLS